MANPLYDTLLGHNRGKSTPFLQLADGTVYSHADFLDMAARYANLLTHLGVAPRDRVPVHVAS